MTCEPSCQLAKSIYRLGTALPTLPSSPTATPSHASFGSHAGHWGAKGYERNGPGLRRQDELRVVEEHDLHRVVAQPEQNRVPGAHPLLHIHLSRAARGVQTESMAHRAQGSSTRRRTGRRVGTHSTYQMVLVLLAPCRPLHGRPAAGSVPLLLLLLLRELA